VYTYISIGIYIYIYIYILNFNSNACYYYIYLRNCITLLLLLLDITKSRFVIKSFKTYFSNIKEKDKYSINYHIIFLFSEFVI